MLKPEIIDINIMATERWQYFYDHLPDSDGLTLIVLKGHLLIEEEINETLSVLVKDPQPLFKEKLPFSHRLAVLRALLGPVLSNAHGIDSVAKLNIIRNKMAHNLVPRKLDEAINEFIKMTFSQVGADFIEELSQSHQVRTGIATICARFVGYRAGYLLGKGSSA